MVEGLTERQRQTLQLIAEAVAERYSAPGQDPRAYVDALIEMNDLGPIPQVGERIRLPR